MKTRVQIALTAALLSVLAQLYLTAHYYPLKMGMAGGQSVCNLNAKFNCDAVAVSAYSSFLGLPVSLFGLMVNAVLFMLILIAWLEWTDHPERMRRWAVLLAGLNLGSSLVMGAISLLFMNSYCMFCIAIYVMSAILFFAYVGVLREPFWMHFKLDLPKIWEESKGILIGFAMVPVGAFLVHQMFMQTYSPAQLESAIKEAVADWSVAPKQEFVAKPSLTMGPASEAAAMTLTEFADFRCPHCKHASYTLRAFVTSHPDVRFEFYSFPLDGPCNEKRPDADGISCRLAGSVYCAEKEARGWEMHDRLFNIQEEMLQQRAIPQVDILLSKQVSEMGLNWESFQRCLADPSTADAITAQSKQGRLVNVRGTPTLFANGRILAGGQLLPVLQEVRKKSLEATTKE